MFQNVLQALMLIKTQEKSQKYFGVLAIRPSSFYPNLSSNLGAIKSQTPQPFSVDSVNLKGAGSRNRKQTCYLYDLYCCPHVAIVFCIDFGGWGESTIKLLLKIHQYLCIPTTYECLVYFSKKIQESIFKITPTF